MGVVFRWIGYVVLTLILLGIVGCSTVVLPRVSAAPPKTTASPDLLGEVGDRPAITTVNEWEGSRAPYWKDTLLNNVYGSIPPRVDVDVVSRTEHSEVIYDGKARLVSTTLALGSEERTIMVDMLLPATEGPHPIIVGAGFCPNHTAIPFEGVVPPKMPYPGFCDGGTIAPLGLFIFGRHISQPPLEDLIDRGYGFAAYYPGEVVPDSSSAAPAALISLPRENGALPHGDYAAIGAWAWIASHIVDYMVEEPLTDGEKVVLFGHSRYGKSSLLAGVIDERVAAVISHQSGTGGASLQRNGVGEPIADITANYPHWFTPAYADLAEGEGSPEFDQHALVALMAPRPLLLGNAARDQWSDPQGAFAAAQAADPVYELYGVEGFDQDRLNRFNPDAELAFQWRSGTHGITPEDWAPFLNWLDVHVGGSSE